MLERVPATAECAAHVFLRSFERPTRSSRVLDPRFWQHDCDQLVTPSTSAVWWPQYLQKIRKIPQASCASDIADAQSAKHATGPKCKRTLRASSSDHFPRRAYSVAATLRAAKPEPQNEYYDGHGFEHDGAVRVKTSVAGDTPRGEQSWRPDGQTRQQNDLAKEDERTHTSAAADNSLDSEIPEMEETLNDSPALVEASNSTRGKRSQPDSRGKTNPREAKARRDAGRSARRQLLEPDEAISPHVDSSLKIHVLNQLLEKDEDLTEKELDQIWRLFIALPDQESFAKFVFPCLARTSILHRVDRATEALRLIPSEEKDLGMYKQGIDLYFGQDRIHEAIDLVRGARPHYAATLRSILCAHLVRRELWHTLSDLLVEHICVFQDLHSCVEISELPEKLIRLRRRLIEGDPVFDGTVMLGQVSSWLSTACIRSESIMSTISAESLLVLLHHPHRNEPRPHLQALITLSRKGVRNGKQDIALRVYRDFLSSHPSQNVKRPMLGSLLSVCAASGYSPTTLTYVLDEFSTHLGKPDPMAYLLVLTSSSKHGTIVEVENFFKRFLDDHKTPLDIRFVSPLIHACARAGERELAEHHFNQVRDKYGFEQDVHCWNMLVSAYAHSSQPLSAFDVFDRMTSADVSPDSYTYGTLITVSADFEDAQTAQDLIVSARKAGIPTTVPMIGALVDTYLSQNDFDKAREFVLATTESKTSDTRLWNSLLRHCAARGKAKLFASTVADMERYQVRQDEWTYATMLVLLTTTGRTMEAVAYLRKLHKSQSFVPSQLHYSIILHGFVMEHNRDMALVIEQEMKSRLPKLDADASKALLAIKLHDSDNPQRSIDLLASSLMGLDPQRTQGVSFQSSGDELAAFRGPAQAYIKLVLHSLLRNHHFELADRLVTLLEQQKSTAHGGGRQVRHRSIQYITLKMDAALAQSNLKAVEGLWSSIFEKITEAGSIKTLRGRLQSMGAEAKLTISRKPSRTATSDSSQQTEAARIPTHAAYQLSKPLNRYMEALARGAKQSSMISSIEQFEAVGFKLSGSNWNKYVQVMARSKLTNHHISAFKTTETLMLRHAQNWTLLRRGLLRQNNTSYYFEKSSPNKPRPVLIKQKKYSATDRLETLHRDPTRKIPTYTTMVFLARVLEDAQMRAQVGDVTEIREISNIASRTKEFLQHMPRLKDSVQGQILRSHAGRLELFQQPRSQKPHQSRVHKDGIHAVATHDAADEHGSTDAARDKQTVSEDGNASPGHTANQAATSTGQIMHLDAAEAEDRIGNHQPADPVARRNSSPLVIPIRRLGQGANGDQIKAAPSVPNEFVTVGKVTPAKTSIYRPLALSYMEYRRERTRTAAKQRQQVVVDDKRWLSARDPPVPQSAAARRALQYRLNQERRSQLREEIQTKGRPTMAPLPTTKQGYYRRRRLYGAPPVRFVFDLNRSKLRYAIRSGKLPEKRKGLAEVDQREYMVDKNTRHLLLDRKQPALRSDVQVTRGKINRNKRLVNLYWNSRRERIRRLRTASIWQEKRDILQARALRPGQRGLTSAGKVDVLPMR